MRALQILVLVLAMPATLAAQTVFKCTEANGTTVYSDKACSADPTKVQTVDTTESLKTGSGGSIAEQAEFATMNGIRRNCDARARSATERYAEQYRRIAKEIASLERSSATMDYRLAGTSRQTDLRTQITALGAEREQLKLAEAQELPTLQSQCAKEVEAEETRQAAAREERAATARAAAQAAADEAAEKKRQADIEAKLKKDAAADEPLGP